jgi:NAD+ kinase
VNKFSRIAIDPNLSKPGCDDAVRRLGAWLQARGRKVVVPPHVLPTPKGVGVVERDDLAAEADLVIVLGGDGTLLSAARRVYPRRVDSRGKLRRPGFLTDISVEEMFPSWNGCSQAVLGNEDPLRASILDRDGHTRDRRHALNDFAIHELATGCSPFFRWSGSAKWER